MMQRDKIRSQLCQRTRAEAKVGIGERCRAKVRQSNHLKLRFCTESTDVGMRGLLSRASNGESRTRVPMLPSGVTPITQSVANYTSSRRRSRCLVIGIYVQLRSDWPCAVQLCSCTASDWFFCLQQKRQRQLP